MPRASRWSRPRSWACRAMPAPSAAARPAIAPSSRTCPPPSAVARPTVCWARPWRCWAACRRTWRSRSCLGMTPSPLGRLVSVDLRTLASAASPSMTRRSRTGAEISVHRPSAAIERADHVVDLRGADEAPSPVTEGALRLTVEQVERQRRSFRATGGSCCVAAAACAPTVRPAPSGAGLHQPRPARHRRMTRIRCVGWRWASCRSALARSIRQAEKAGDETCRAGRSFTAQAGHPVGCRER